MSRNNLEDESIVQVLSRQVHVHGSTRLPNNATFSLIRLSVPFGQLLLQWQHLYSHNGINAGGPFH
jgi:hypothetical protein